MIKLVKLGKERFLFKWDKYKIGKGFLYFFQIFGETISAIPAEIPFLCNYEHVQN